MSQYHEHLGYVRDSIRDALLNLEDLSAVADETILTNTLFEQLSSLVERIDIELSPVVSNNRLSKFADEDVDLL